MKRILLLDLLFIIVFAAGKTSGQRTINTVKIGDNKFFFSDTTPYSPRLNWFLAYQYCRNIGMDLMSQQTQEESQVMFDFLEKNGKSSYSYWTSANQLGSPMWIWMTTGQPLNSTFHYWSQGGPPLTKSQNGCMNLQNRVWSAVNCMDDLAFVCQLTRCYYFDYAVTNQIDSSDGKIAGSSTKPKSLTTTNTNQRKLKTNPESSNKPLLPNSNSALNPKVKQFSPDGNLGPKVNLPEGGITQTPAKAKPISEQISNSSPLSNNNQFTPLPDIPHSPQHTFTNLANQNEIIPKSVRTLSQVLLPPLGDPAEGLTNPERDSHTTSGRSSQRRANNKDFGAATRRFQRKEEFSWAFS